MVFSFHRYRCRLEQQLIKKEHLHRPKQDELHTKRKTCPSADSRKHLGCPFVALRLHQLLHLGYAFA